MKIEYNLEIDNSSLLALKLALLDIELYSEAQQLIEIYEKKSNSTIQCFSYNWSPDSRKSKGDLRFYTLDLYVSNNPISMNVYIEYIRNENEYILHWL